MQKKVALKNLVFSNENPFILIAGPCQAESSEHAVQMAGELQEMCQKMGIGYVFKASFDKANRTSLSGKRGLGLEAGLKAFEAVKTQVKCPILTDIHESFQCEPVAAVVDILQIPAFLCRQTDLILAAAKTGAVINVKKGQFLAPWDMKNIVAKIESTGNEKILLTERGVSFGYNTLVVDMRALPIMKQTGYPVIFDATHSVQQPGGQGTSSGGQREFAPVLANCAITTGIAGIFIETHETPDTAPSDGPNMIPLHQMPMVLEKLRAFDQVAKGK